MFSPVIYNDKILKPIDIWSVCPSASCLSFNLSIELILEASGLSRSSG